LSSFTRLKAARNGAGVLEVRLANGPVNAADQPMYEEIATLFRNVDAVAADISAIVLAAEGRHFCGGNDLDEFATMTSENGGERMWRVREAFFAISECTVPVVAAVHGVALGTGLAIAASCDVIVAAPDARFGLPELTVGVMGGARHLARFAPQPVVRRMFFTGEHLTASELSAAGGAVIVTADELPIDHAHRIAARIARMSPTAVRVGKAVLDRIEGMDLRSGYEFEQAATVRMAGFADSKEALAAFREKRDPDYLPLSRRNALYPA
jgi:enoyl-CoA hydratase